MAQAFDVRRLKLTGEAFPIVEQVGSYQTHEFFSASATGALVYRTGAGSEAKLLWFDREGKSVGAASSQGGHRDPALSPDGTRVAAARSDAQANSDIWLLDPIRGTSTRFTSHPAWESNPVWSPDGAQIAFASTRNGPLNIYRKMASNAGAEEALLESGDSKITNDWSRDGRFLLYTSDDPKTGYDLWVLLLEGDRKPQPYLQTQFRENQGQFSPDGHWVAYTSDESGRLEVYVQPFPAAAASGRFRPTAARTQNGVGMEKSYSILAWTRGLMAVEVKTAPKFEAGLPRLLFQTRIVGPPGLNTGRYAAAADGKRFLVSSLEDDGSASSPFHVVLNWRGGRQ